MIETTATIRESVEAAFPFSVEKFPLSGPDNMKTPLYGLFRTDESGEFVSGTQSKSKVYVPHTTDDVVTLAESSAEIFGDDVKVKCHWNKGHYVTIQPSNEYRHTVFGSDTVWPRVVIRAGYDGQSFSGTMGYYRDACKNLAMFRQVTGTSVRFRHTQGLTDKIDDLKLDFQAMSGGWEAMKERIGEMDSRRLSLVGFLNEMYPQPDSDASQNKVTIHKNRTKKIVDRIMRERRSTGRPDPDNVTNVTAWEAFNGVQGYTQWDSIKRPRKGELILPMDRIISAAGNADVHRAEKLAMSMSA